MDKKRLETKNPAFKYVQDNYSISIGYLSKLASMIYDHSKNSAEEFSKRLNRKSTEKLEHYFLDYYRLSIHRKVI